MNILFVGHDFKFAVTLIKHFSSKCNVKIDKWQGHCKHDEDKTLELMNWANIVFCEWCLGNAVFCSNNIDCVCCD